MAKKEYLNKEGLVCYDQRIKEWTKKKADDGDLSIIITEDVIDDSVLEDIEDVDAKSLALSSQKISVSIVNGRVYVNGANKFLEAGFVPFLFRNCRKQNKVRGRYNTGYKDEKRKGPIKKGWNLYGSQYSINIIGGKLVFSTNEKKKLCKPAEGYNDGSPYGFFTFTDKGVRWGARVVYDTNRNKKKDGYRMLRFQLGVAFGRPIKPSRISITPAMMVSNLATFSLVQAVGKDGEPNWVWGR